MSKRSSNPLQGFTAKGETRKYVQHEYVDRSSDIQEVETRNDREVLKMYDEGTVSGPFPIKLQTLLRMTHTLAMDDIISWQVHGRSFQVRCSKEFESVVMRKFFNQTKISSFRRQLNLYDFKRLTHGPDSGSYYHEMFLRGKPLQASRMSRTKVKGTKFRATSSPDKEPNFYALPFLPAFEDFNNEVPKATNTESQSRSEDTCDGEMPNAAVDTFRTCSAPQNDNTGNRSMYRESEGVMSRANTQLGFPDLPSSFVPPSAVDSSSSGGLQNEKERYEVGQLLVGMQQNFQNLHQSDQIKNRTRKSDSVHIFNQINVNVHVHAQPSSRHFPSLKEMQELQQRINAGNIDSSAITEGSRHHPSNASIALTGDGSPNNNGCSMKSSIHIDALPQDSSSFGTPCARFVENSLSPFASASASASTTGSALLSNFSQMSEYENLQQAILMNQLQQQRLEQQRLEMDSSSSFLLDYNCNSNHGSNLSGGGTYGGGLNLSMSQHSMHDAQELLKSTITSGSHDAEGPMINSTSV